MVHIKKIKLIPIYTKINDIGLFVPWNQYNFYLKHFLIQYKYNNVT